MAIRMIRKPSTSESPQYVSNVDDIIPMRYAYGNQNGYVKDKGDELGYDTSGGSFKVLSGRVVLQGVESDIDANGVTIEITNEATTNYYIVYYNVNLATNTTAILGSYSPNGYPELPASDNLTENNGGSANLLLYKFQVTSSVISEVEKVVQEIEYAKDIVVENSKKVNNLEFKQDENGVLRIGDIIIPQKKVLWEGNSIIGTQNNEFVGSYTEITNLEDINLNDTLEIEIKIEISDNLGFYHYLSSITKIKVQEYAFSADNSDMPTCFLIRNGTQSSSLSASIVMISLQISKNEILFYSPKIWNTNTVYTFGGDCYITKISKIIE